MAQLIRPCQNLSFWSSALTSHRSSRVFCTTLIALSAEAPEVPHFP